MSLFKNLAIASALATSAFAASAQPVPAASATAEKKAIKSQPADCSKKHNHAVEKGGTAAPCPATPASQTKPMHDHQKANKQG